MLTRLLVVSLSVCALAVPAGAQDKGRRASQGIPPGHLPPPGECRVWYDNRPPGQQPAPTSCSAARAEAARTSGRVIYGDDRRRGDDDRRDRKECDDKDRRKGECDRDRDRDDDDRDDDDRDDDRNDDDRDDDDRDDDDRDDDRGRDRDRDRNRDRDDCIDHDRDGRCDYVRGDYPATMPEMVWGVIFGRGERTEDVRRWVGAGDIKVRYVDKNRDGRPEIVNWFAGDRIVQRWIDSNGDGRADQVGLYENGRAVRVIK